MPLDPATATELGELLAELSANKDTRSLIARAIKKAKPDSRHAQAFSDIDVEERFEELKKKREQEDMERQQSEIVSRMNSQRARLLSGDGGRKYDETQVKEIEALMQRKGVVDYEDGATLYAATLPPTDPKPSSHDPKPVGATYEFPEWAKFGKDPNKAARETAHTVIGEFMRKRA